MAMRIVAMRTVAMRIVAMRIVAMRIVAMEDKELAEAACARAHAVHSAGGASGIGVGCSGGSAHAVRGAVAVASMSRIVQSCPIAPLSWRRSSINVSMEWRGAPTRNAHNRLRPEAGVSRTKKEHGTM